MTSSSSWKHKGNVAYGMGDYEAAIEAYSKAIDISPDNYTLYSNRSAAYLKSGDSERALADASQCIALKHDNHEGYGRKGAAYHVMRRYDRAIAVYKEGLKVCPDEEHLLKGLRAARRAKAQGSSASKAVKKMEIVKRASKRKQAKTCATVSAFVQQTREELKLKMAEIQAQLDLINDLAAMEDEAKLDLLFTLIDRDGDGTIDAKELAGAMCKRKRELSFQDSVNHAIDMVATFDTDGDARLDFNEFRECINVMLKELNVSFVEFSEFLVFQISTVAQNKDEEDLASVDIDKEVKAREELFDMLSCERMEELFVLFDKDGSGELTFKEVAIGLYLSQITRNVEEATKTAMNLLLMMDKDDSRTLHYEQFGRLIMAIVAAANSTFEDIADDLELALTSNDTVSEDDLATLMVADVIYETAREDKRIKKHDNVDLIIDTLSYGRLKKLFDLWDVNHDGDITFAELTIGLQTFQDAVGIEGDPEREARALLGFDGDGDNRLDPREFSEAMIYYAKTFGVDLHTLIDFMCVTYAMGDNDKQGFQHAFGRALSSMDKSPVRPRQRFSYMSDDDFDDE